MRSLEGRGVRHRRGPSHFDDPPLNHSFKLGRHFRGMSVLQSLPLLVFPALVIVAAQHDVTTMTIPNWISAALVVSFAVAAPIAGLSFSTLATSAGLCAAALVAGIAMFALRWIGGGDAKLFAASALWLGLGGLPSFLIWTSIAGGLLSLALLSARRALVFSGLPSPRVDWLSRLLKPEGDVPYGVAIAAGALAAFPESALVAALQGPVL